MSPEDVRELRQRLRCTARVLGEALGVEGSAVMAWERGESFPTKRHVDAMARLDAQGPSALGRPLPPKARPAKASPARAKPVQADPVQADPVQADPAQADPEQANAAQTSPAQTNPASPGAARGAPTEPSPEAPVPTLLARGAPSAPSAVATLSDPRLWELVAKLCTHSDLLEAALQLAAGYPLPSAPTTPPTE